VLDHGVERLPLPAVVIRQVPGVPVAPDRLDAGVPVDGRVGPGEQALSSVVKKPTVERFMFASRRFARETGLLTEQVAEAVEAVSDVDGEASMAMLGESVFALGRGLTEAGYDPRVCEVHAGGAALL
jgi:pantoate kinase